jgi:hypothetical protein
MSSSPRILRATAGVSLFWLIWALLINFLPVIDPDVPSGAYLFAQDDLSKPAFVEAFTPAYISALNEQTAGRLIDQYIEVDGVQNDTSFFMPAKMNERQRTKALSDSSDMMRAEQSAKKMQVGLHKASYAAKLAFIPFVVLLTVGAVTSAAFRWIKGQSTIRREAC